MAVVAQLLDKLEQFDDVSVSGDGFVLSRVGILSLKLLLMV